jgi:hypothetical protein
MKLKLIRTCASIGVILEGKAWEPWGSELKQLFPSFSLSLSVSLSLCPSSQKSFVVGFLFGSSCALVIVTDLVTFSAFSPEKKVTFPYTTWLIKNPGSGITLLLFETPGGIVHRWIDMPFTFPTRYKPTLYLPCERHSAYPREPNFSFTNFNLTPEEEIIPMRSYTQATAIQIDDYAVI